MLYSKKRRKAKTKTKKITRKKRVKKIVKKKVKGIKKIKKIVKKSPPVTKGKETQIGKVTHYFPHVKAGAVMIEQGSLVLGDTIHIKGHTTDFKQQVKSLQIDRVPITEAKVGDEVGILVKSRVRINDKVYKMKS